MAEGNGESFVRITNREVYDRLGTVEAKLDNALRTIESRDASIAEHSKRIRSLELRFYGVLAGLVAALAVLVGGPAGIAAGAMFVPPIVAREIRRHHGTR